MRYDAFKGCIPRLDAAQLPQGYATMAQNTDVRAGVLRAMMAPHVAKELSASTRTCYLHDGAWRQFGNYVEVASSMSLDDHRIYITGIGAPKQTTKTLLGNGEFRTLGMSAPAQALTMQFFGTPAQDAEIKHSVSYTYTRVNRFGEESGPAPETVVVDVLEGQGIRLTGFSVPADPAEDVVAYRVYRAEAAGYFWIYYPFTPQGNPYHEGDMPSGMMEFLDWSDAIGDIRPESLSTLLTGGMGVGRDWSPPPVDMRGICSHVGGVWAGFRGNEVCISERMAAYAWPEAYRKTLDADIVGIAPFHESLIVLTRTFPYVVSGSDPETMQQQKLPYPQACVSAKTIMVTPQGVLFASPDGLCLATPASCEVVTSKLMLAEQWRDWHPENMMGIYYNDRCYLFSLDESGDLMGKGMMIDIHGDEGLVFINIGARVVGGLHEPLHDAMMLVLERSPGARTLERWEAGGSSLPAVWESPDFRFQKPVNLACGVTMHSGSASLTIEADGYAQDIDDQESGESFWLESGFLGREWKFALFFTGEVRRVRFGFSKGDLQ